MCRASRLVLCRFPARGGAALRGEALRGKHCAGRFSARGPCDRRFSGGGEDQSELRDAALHGAAVLEEASCVNAGKRPSRQRTARRVTGRVITSHGSSTAVQALRGAALKHCAGRSGGRSKRGAVQEWEALRGSGCSALRGAVQARGGSSAGQAASCGSARGGEEASRVNAWKRPSRQKTARRVTGRVNNSRGSTARGGSAAGGLRRFRDQLVGRPARAGGSRRRPILGGSSGVRSSRGEAREGAAAGGVEWPWSAALECSLEVQPW